MARQRASGEKMGEAEEEKLSISQDGLGSDGIHFDGNSSAETPLDDEPVDTLKRNQAREPINARTVPRTIHFIGNGNIGNYVAHSLAGMPNPPPITLLLRKKAMHEWNRIAREKIEIIINGIAEPRTGFAVESSISLRQLQNQSLYPEQDELQEEHIWNLILAVKATQTIPALLSVRSRLNRDSTIVFLQNGMGIIEQVNEKVFPDVEARPSYIIGLVSHGLKSFRPSNRFQVIHAGNGTIALGLLPRYPGQRYDKTDDNLFPPTARYLLRTITRCPVLCAVGFSPNEIFQLQLEKLVINALINPLTAILGCPNGGLLNNTPVTRLARLLLSEIALVISLLPEMENVLNAGVRFSAARLETLMVTVAERTAENTSSMLQDVAAGRQTEVEYINGYIVRRGQEVGVRCVMNYMVLQMVKAKRQMTHQEVEDYLPMMEESGRPRGESH